MFTNFPPHSLVHHLTFSQQQSLNIVENIWANVSRELKNIYYKGQVVFRDFNADDFYFIVTQ